MGPVRAQLRAATAEIHEALHGAPPFARIAAGSMTRDDYGALLAVLLAYHRMMLPPCAVGARALAAPDLEAAQARRVAALQDDLVFMGGAPLPDRAGPDSGDPAFAVGCLYTVMGSSLGGKVIHDQLDGLLGGAEGRRFFAGSAQDAGCWRLFCDRLEAQGAALDRTRICMGANDAFARFAGLLEAASI